MKRCSLLLPASQLWVVIGLMAIYIGLPGSAEAQIVINTQNGLGGFVQLIGNPWNPWDDPDPIDYIIQPRQDPAGAPYDVPGGFDWRLSDGVNIQIAPDVEILIHGQMRTTPGQIGNPAPTIINIPGQGNWCALTIVGNGAFDDGIGEIHLLGINLAGGGAGVWNPQGGQPDWRGMIRLTGQNQRPQLIIGDPQVPNPSTINNSASNGIVVLEEVGLNPGQGGSFTVELYDVAMNDAFTPIALSGIKMNDRESVDPNQPVLLHNPDGHLIVSDCDIQFCGWHGIVGYVVADGDYTIMNNSVISDNGVNPPLEDEVGFGAVGAGIYFMNLQAYNMRPFLQVLDSDIMRNSWDGIRLKEMMGLGWILHNDIAFNEQRGIYYDIRSGDHFGVIQECVVHDNDWEGIYCEKGPNGLHNAMKIRQNEVLDNCADIAGHPLGDQNPWLIASITLRGAFQDGGNEAEDVVQPSNRFPEILNNRIRGGKTGIRLARTNGVPPGLPKNIYIKNNIQYRAEFQGLRIDDLDFENEDYHHPSEIHNNVFYGNQNPAFPDPEDVDEFECGIWIDQDVNFLGGGGFIQNNILSGEDAVGSDIGIYCRGAGPNFPYNGFDNNLTHVQNCTSNPSVGRIAAEDSRFVNPAAGDPAQGFENFHLLWHSPMINRGNVDAAFNDPSLPFNGIDRDGSRNDIGAYGGPGADDYGYDPYCVIDAAHNNLTNAQLPQGPAEPNGGGRQWLEKDIYRVFSDISTPNGETIDIGNPAAETGAAYFEFAGDYRWSAIGAFHANGDPDNGIAKTIYFKRLDPQEQWKEIRLSGVSSHWLRGCVVDGAEFCLYLAGVVGGGGDPELVEVSNCELLNAGKHGILAYYSVELDCINTQIRFCGGSGIYFNNNEDQTIEDESTLFNVEIEGCGHSSTSNVDAGIACVYSNPEVDGCFFFHNPIYGVYAGSEGSPLIDGENGSANNILNNGEWGDQTSTKGAEIRISGSSAFHLVPPIRDNNLYDVRDPDEDDTYERQGRIISRTSSTAQFLVDDNYYGDELQADHLEEFEEFDDDFVWANDTYQSGGTNFTQGAIEAAVLDIDKWEATTDDNREPENRFEEGLFAIRSGDPNTAAACFRDWIENEPDSPMAPNAARIMFGIEKSRGGDLNRLRGEFLEIAESTEENYPELAWTTELMAVRCLFYQRQFADAIQGYRNIREDAPDETDALLVDISILEAEELLNGGIDAIGSNYNRIASLHSRIEEIESNRGLESQSVTPPAKFDLTSAYPNPFNSSIRVQFTVPEAGLVKMAVFDIAGREVASGERWYAAGNHTAAWKAEGYAAGSYLLRLESVGQTQTRKITLVK